MPNEWHILKKDGKVDVDGIMDNFQGEEMEVDKIRCEIYFIYSP